MLDRDLATKAATQATHALGLGAPTFHGFSSAVTFTTPHAFLRVVPDGYDCPGTVAIARFVTAHLGGAAPLADALALEIESTHLWVEAYQRLSPVTTDLGSWRTVGERLADLHALVPDPTLRPARRLLASRTRLQEGSPEMVAELTRTSTPPTRS